MIIDKGCVVNSLYNYPTHMTFFTTPELLEIGDIPMTSMYEKPTRTEALKYYRRVAEHYKLDIHQYERVESIDGEDGAFTVPTTDRMAYALLQREESHHIHRLLRRAEFAERAGRRTCQRSSTITKSRTRTTTTTCWWSAPRTQPPSPRSNSIWTGARVTLVHRGPAIHKHVKYWIKPNIENRIKNGEIKAYFNSQVTEIRPDSVRIQTPDGDDRDPERFRFRHDGLQPRLDFSQCERNRAGTGNAKAPHRSR